MLYYFTAGQNMSTYYWKIYKPYSKIDSKLEELDNQLKFLLQQSFEEEGNLEDFEQPVYNNQDITDKNIKNDNGGLLLAQP